MKQQPKVFFYEILEFIDVDDNQKHPDDDYEDYDDTFNHDDDDDDDCQQAAQLVQLDSTGASLTKSVSL